MTRKLTKALAILTLIGITLSAYSAFAQEWDRSPAQRSMRGRDDRTEAPAPPPQGRQADDQQDTAARYPDEVRSIDGTANNLVNPLWGSAGVEFLRLTTVGYADESSEPSGDARPNAREISNACAAYDGDAPNTVNASDFLGCGASSWTTTSRKRLWPTRRRNLTSRCLPATLISIPSIRARSRFHSIARTTIS